MAEQQPTPPDNDPGAEISDHVNDYLESLRARFDQLADRIEEASQASIDRNRAELEEMISPAPAPPADVADPGGVDHNTGTDTAGPAESSRLADRLRDLTAAEAAATTPDEGDRTHPVAADEPARPVNDVAEWAEPQRRREAAPMPRPVNRFGQEPRRWVVGSLLLLILLSAAFLAGRWWSSGDGDGSAATPTTLAQTPTTIAVDPQPTPTDESIRNAVEGAVNALAPTGVAFDVTDGVVALTGAVPDITTRDALSSVLLAISGVRQIDNRILIAAPVPATPEELQLAADTARIATGFDNLAVTVVDGVATISGVVPVEAVGTGVFGAVAPLRTALEGIAGIEQVLTRVQLRGDEASLRAELQDLIDDAPIIFGSNSAELDEATIATLDQAAEIIISHPGLRVLIAGHADPAGGAAQNEVLATGRGQAVLGYLLSKGVAVTRLQVVSYGELFPEAGSDLGISRRIEFEVAP